MWTVVGVMWRVVEDNVDGSGGEGVVRRGAGGKRAR